MAKESFKKYRKKGERRQGVNIKVTIEAYIFIEYIFHREKKKTSTCKEESTISFVQLNCEMVHRANEKYCQLTHQKGMGECNKPLKRER